MNGGMKTKLHVGGRRLKTAIKVHEQSSKEIQFLILFIVQMIYSIIDMKGLQHLQGAQ